MRLVGPVVGQLYRVALALIVVLFSGTHIPAGLVRAILQCALTVVTVLASLQQKVHSAVVAALGEVALTQSPEEIEIQKSSQAVKGVCLAEFLPPIRSAVDLVAHLHGVGGNHPLCHRLSFGRFEVSGKAICQFRIGQEFALAVDIVVQQVGVSVLYPEKILDQSDKGIKQFADGLIRFTDHQNSVGIFALQIRMIR